MKLQKKIQSRIIFPDMQKSYEIQISTSIHKFYWNAATLIGVCFVFELQGRGEELQQRLDGLQSLKCLQSGPLQIKYTSLCARCWRCRGEKRWASQAGPLSLTVHGPDSQTAGHWGPQAECVQWAQSKGWPGQAMDRLPWEKLAVRPGAAGGARSWEGAEGPEEGHRGGAPGGGQGGQGGRRVWAPQSHSPPSPLPLPCSFPSLPLFPPLVPFLIPLTPRHSWSAYLAQFSPQQLTLPVIQAFACSPTSSYTRIWGQEL